MFSLVSPSSAPAAAARAHPASDRLWLWSLTVLGTALWLHSLSTHGFAGDLLMDIANGRWILAHHTVPLTNHLTPTLHGAFWAEPEWLYGVYVALFWAWGGRMAVFWSLTPFVAGTVYGMARVAAPLGRVWGTLLVLAAVFSLHGFLSPRPQLVSYALFIAGLWAVQQWRQHRDAPVWIFAAVASVWTQMHPSAILDPLLLVGEALLGPRRPRRALLAPILLAFLGWSLRPGGVWGTGGLFATLFAPAIRSSIREWTPWHPFSAIGWIFLPWMAALPWLVVRGWQRREPITIAWAVLGAAMTALAIRFAPYDVLGVVAIVGSWGPPSWTLWRPQTALDRTWMRTLVAGAVGVSVLTASTARFPVRVPVAAFQQLRHDHAHEVLAYYAWGDALDLYGPPSFADGRAELWSVQPWWPAYVRMNRGQESPAVFAARWVPAVDAIAWPLATPGAYQLDHSPAWQAAGTVTWAGGRVGLWRRRSP